MVYNICARNVNTALHDALWWLKVSGVVEESRNGPVVVSPVPVVTTYSHPCERVLFSASRDCNPYFGFFEAMYMLAGRSDLAWLAQFNARMAEFSDDGEYLHGTYGFRWREWFGFDQLRYLIEHLRVQPGSRRAVLTMWSPLGDLIASEGVGGIGSKDIPCNTQAYFDLRGGVLNMTVTCRSNDVLFGAMGANAVHFSFLLEYVAMHIGVLVGVYRQFSNNFHAYTALPKYPSADPSIIGCDDRYESGRVRPLPLLQPGETAEEWDRDLDLFFFVDTTHVKTYYTRFFGEVAAPMLVSWHERKRGRLQDGRNVAELIAAEDWRVACLEWIDRREGVRNA